MLLPIKTQGFPQVISQLGIQSPLQGPFWGFESTVIPVYKIGSSSVEPKCSVPFHFLNHDTNGLIVNPQAVDRLALLGDAITGTRATKRGFYEFRAKYNFINTGVAGTNFITWNHYNFDKTINRDYEFIAMTGGTTVPPASIQGEVNGVFEAIQAGDILEFHMFNNSVATASAWVKVYWYFIGEEFLP